MQEDSTDILPRRGWRRTIRPKINIAPKYEQRRILCGCEDSRDICVILNATGRAARNTDAIDSRREVVIDVCKPRKGMEHGSLGVKGKE